MSGERSHGRSPWREAYEMLALRKGSEPESSVTIKRNAKGAWECEITVRGSDAYQAMHDAGLLADNFARDYPYPLEGAVSPQDASEHSRKVAA